MKIQLSRIKESLIIVLILSRKKIIKLIRMKSLKIRAKCISERKGSRKGESCIIYLLYARLFNFIIHYNPDNNIEEYNFLSLVKN